MKFRKFLCFVLILAMMMSLGVTAFAEDVNENMPKSVYNEQLTHEADIIDIETLNSVDSSLIDGHLIREDNTISSVTIDDVDRIIYERGIAVLRGDAQKVSELEAKLDDLGVRDSYPEEIKALSVDSIQAAELASSSVTFKTTNYTATANGKTYEIKKTTALPTTSCNLFHSAAVNNTTTSSSVDSGHYQLLKVAGTCMAGVVNSTLGKFVSAYDTLKSVISGFSSSTVVYGITASYSCAALEQVSFYQYKTSSGSLSSFATSSYAQTAFSSTIFSTNYAGGSKQGLNMSINALEDTIYSSYSYNTGTMLERYFTTYIFDKKSQVTNVSFYHDANGTKKTIKTLGMLCPTSTSDIH